MINVGDIIYLTGGYGNSIKWLNGNDGYFAKVVGFIPGQNDNSAMLVEFDSKILTADQVAGKHAVLEHRYEKIDWNHGDVVHIELCDFIPENKPWSARRKGEWVESHGVVRKGSG